MTHREVTRTVDRYLDPHALRAFGAALDALRQDVRRSLGEQDLAYIRRLMRWQRRLEAGGRVALHVGGLLPPLWLAGVASLSLSKILDNMEIGHNIMHGQYDWSGDPALRGRTFEWNNLCPGNEWRRSHNHRHHRFTNIVGVDRDIGYGALRMADEQPWRPRHLAQPLVALGLCLVFEWGIALHDMEIDRVFARDWRWRDHRPAAAALARKARRLIGREYLLYPLLAGPFFLPVMLGNLAANAVRNVWAFTVIFCGHFPEGVVMFTPAECEAESRGEWYVRQLLGSCNIEGGRLFHLMSGHLSHQIEHHLFPGIPAHRYPEMAAVVQALCREHGLPYHTGPLRRQFGSVVRRILRLSLPGGRRRAARPLAA